MEGRAEAERSLPPLPKHFTALCEDGANFWPSAWEGEFGEYRYFYLAGFVEFLNNDLKEINVTRIKRKFDLVLEAAKEKIPDHWIDWDPSIPSSDPAYQSREERLDALDLSVFGRRRVQALRDRKPVSFYTALLAIMCVRELMGHDSANERKLNEIFEIRWAGYSVMPWFGDLYADITEEHFDQLSGRTAHWNNRTIFENILAGYTITKPLAERIREYVLAIRAEKGLPKLEHRIERIHARTRESQGTVAKLEKRAAEGEIVYFEWPESEDD